MNIKSMNPNLSLFFFPNKTGLDLTCFFLTQIKQDKNIIHNLNKSDHDIVW